MLPHLGQGANHSIEDGMAFCDDSGARGSGERASGPPRLRATAPGGVAQVQRGARESGLRYNSACSDLGVRDAEIVAHAAFRKRLYDHDVVPDAQAAAATLPQWPAQAPTDGRLAAAIATISASLRLIRERVERSND